MAKTGEADKRSTGRRFWSPLVTGERGAYVLLTCPMTYPKKRDD